MAFDSLFQITIIILWKNIVMAIPLIPFIIQRFRLQKQHAQITTNVTVFSTNNVMVVNGGYMKDMKLDLLRQDIAHGHQVS